MTFKLKFSIKVIYYWSHKDHKETKKPREKKDFDWSSYAPKPVPFGLSDSGKLTALLKTTNNNNSNVNGQNKLEKIDDKFLDNNKAESKPVTKSEQQQQQKEQIKTPPTKETTVKKDAAPKQAQTKLAAIESSKPPAPSNKPDSKQQTNNNNNNNNSTKPASVQKTVAENKNKPASEVAPKAKQENTNDSLNESNLIPSTDSQPSFIRSSNKITFYPVQTNKIYPQLTNSFSSVNSVPSDNYDKINRQNSLSPVEDASKLDFNDIKRPSSSVKHNPNAYIKNDVYPKFPQVQNNDGKNNNGDSESESSVVLKTRTSPDGDESKDKNNNMR
jgi:outer membrane biosynthesis protein TonB